MVNNTINLLAKFKFSKVHGFNGLIIGDVQVPKSRLLNFVHRKYNTLIGNFVSRKTDLFLSLLNFLTSQKSKVSITAF